MVAIAAAVVLFGLSVTAPLWMSVLPLFGVDLGGSWLGTLIWMLPFIVPPLLIGAIVLFITTSVFSATRDKEPDPLATLEQRYTDGEIGFSEYEKRLDHLFELTEDHDTHPRLKQLAIRYARGEFDREALDRRVEKLQADEPELHSTDIDYFLRSAFDGDSVTVTGSQPTEQPTAVQRLRHRYADGELSHTEYEQRLSVLRETDTPSE